MTRDVFTPLIGTGETTLADLAVAPCHFDRAECGPARITPAGARIQTVYYPTSADAQVALSITLDSAGRLVRSSETHGVLRFHYAPEDTSRAAQDSARRAQMRALRQTVVSLDYVVDPGLVLRREGNGPPQSMTVSTRAVEDSPLLDHPIVHAREAMRACHMTAGSPGTPADAPDPASAARQYFDLINNARWDEAAAMLDSASVDRLRATTIEGLLGWAESGAPTRDNRPPGQSRGFSWASPRDTAMLLRTEDTTIVPTPTGPVRIGVLAGLTPRGLAARTLQAGYAPSVGTRVYDVLGVVPEGDTLAHALYRERFAIGFLAPSGPSPYELDLYLRDGKWRVIAQSPGVPTSGLMNYALNYQTSAHPAR